MKPQAQALLYSYLYVGNFSHAVSQAEKLNEYWRDYYMQRTTLDSGVTVLIQFDTLTSQQRKETFNNLQNGIFIINKGNATDCIQKA